MELGTYFQPVYPDANSIDPPEVEVEAQNWDKPESHAEVILFYDKDGNERNEPFSFDLCDGGIVITDWPKSFPKSDHEKCEYVVEDIALLGYSFDSQFVQWKRRKS